MANRKHLEILEKGVSIWNAWRLENRETRPNLSAADLRGADLFHADLLGADLRGAKLRGVNLKGACILGAELINTDLMEANLSGADLRDADLRRAVLSRTCFASVDLRHTRLELARHIGYSEVAVSTLAKSKGKIPDAFLKGCGLQDWEVTAAKLHNPDLTSEQVIDLTYEIAHIKAESQVNPIFISYSRTDSDFVDAMETRLNKKRIRFWRDVHDATAGPLEEIVDRAMRINSIVLLVLSEHSVESDWVEWEV